MPQAPGRWARWRRLQGSTAAKDLLLDAEPKVSKALVHDPCGLPCVLVKRVFREGNRPMPGPWCRTHSDGPATFDVVTPCLEL